MKTAIDTLNRNNSGKKPGVCRFCVVMIIIFCIGLFGNLSSAGRVYAANNTSVKDNEPGSSFLTAVDIAAETTTVVTPITNGGKYFKFVPAVSGKYIFQSSLYTSGDPYIKVYDANQRLKGSNDDSGNQRNFKLELSLTGGSTYYIFANGAKDDGYQMVINYKDWTLSAEALTVYAGDTTNSLYVYDAEVTSVVSSNPAVATVAIGVADSEETEIVVTKVGLGTATVTVTAGNGTQKSFTVTTEYKPFNLSKTEIIFGKKYPYDNGFSYVSDGETSIVAAVSSKTKVASVRVDTNYNEVVITPNKPGSTYITVTDNIGRTAGIRIVVKKTWKQANLKMKTYGYLSYGKRKMTVHSKPGATVTVKIGGKIFKTKIGKKGYKTINVKKFYKYKTKYTITAKYKKTKATVKGKVSSRASAYMQTIYSCQYTIPVKVYGVTKGDTVMITVGGHTYKRKINYSADSTTVIFTTRYKNSNYYSIRIRVKDKYNQKMFDRTSTIRWR